jgi:hypothetical protein
MKTNSGDQQPVTSGKYIWAPAPALADAALEEFRIAQIKRQKSTHVLVCPRLMTPLWLKQLYKAQILFLPSSWDNCSCQN